MQVYWELVAVVGNITMRIVHIVGVFVMLTTRVASKYAYVYNFFLFHFNMYMSLLLSTFPSTRSSFIARLPRHTRIAYFLFNCIFVFHVVLYGYYILFIRFFFYYFVTSDTRNQEINIHVNSSDCQQAKTSVAFTRWVWSDLQDI